MQAVKAAAISIDNINFQINKINKPLINFKTMISEKYYNFLDIFSKKALDIVAKHFKYNSKIRLLEKHKNFGYNPLRRIL